MTRDQLLALEAKGRHVDMQTYFDIQKFVNHEIYLLNHEMLDEWSHSLEDDLVYWAPIRENILSRNRIPEITTARV